MAALYSSSPGGVLGHSSRLIEEAHTASICAEQRRAVAAAEARKVFLG